MIVFHPHLVTLLANATEELASNHAIDDEWIHADDEGNEILRRRTKRNKIGRKEGQILIKLPDGKTEWRAAAANES